MPKDGVTKIADELAARQLPCGGFAEWPRSAYRVDATAWAVLALREDIFADAVTRARTRLAQSQLKDGRVPVSDDHPGAFWPTALSILAWHTSPYQLQNQNNAVQFSIGQKTINPNQQYCQLGFENQKGHGKCGQIISVVFEKPIFQRGEIIQNVRTNFKLIDKIEAHRKLL